LYVNRIHWKEFIPTLPVGGTGGTGGISFLGGTGINLEQSGAITTISASIAGGTGISVTTQTGVTGDVSLVISASSLIETTVLGGTGIEVSSTGGTFTVSSSVNFVAGTGITIGQTGNTYTFASYPPVVVPGPKGEILYYSSVGDTSSSQLTFDSGILNIPTTILSSGANTGVLRAATQSRNTYLQPGMINTPNSASSLFVTPINGLNSTLAVDTLLTRVGVNLDEPSSTLDVSGQTQITFNATNGADKVYNTGATGSSGSFAVSPGSYFVRGWGGGGSSQGGTGGAGGYTEANITVTQGGTFTWNSAFGGANGGGNALVLNYANDDVPTPQTILIVPGGGAGITGGVGAAAGETGGLPSPEGGRSADYLTPPATATYNDPANWSYSLTASIGLTGATFTNGRIFGRSSLSGAGTIIEFLPGASQVSGPSGATYTVSPGTYVTVNANNMLFSGTTFSSIDTSAIVSYIPPNSVNGGTGTTGITGNSLATYSPWPGNTLPAISGNPTIRTPGGQFSFGTTDVTWVSGNLGFTAGSTYTFFFDGTISDMGPVGNNKIVLINPGNVTVNQSLPAITNSLIAVGSLTVPANSTVGVASRRFVNFGIEASGNTGSTGAGGGATGGGSAALVTGVTGMTMNTQGNMPAGGGAGIGMYMGSSGLSYIDSTSYGGNGIYPHFNEFNPMGEYGGGGTAGMGGVPYLVIQEVISTTLPALIVNGDELVNGNLTVTGSVNIGANAVITTQETGSTAGVTGHLTIIEQNTPYAVNELINKILIRPTSGPPQGLSITAQTGVSYTNDCMVSIDGDLRVDGDGAFSGNVSGATAVFGGSVIFEGGNTLASNAGVGWVLTGTDGLTISTLQQNAATNRLISSTNVYAPDFIATSDVRTKNSIITIDSALDKVMKMRGVFFERNEQPGERRVGVIAQEIEEVLPEVVNTDSEGMKSVSYGSIIGLLIEAIKELKQNTK
jgi:hypothetical protein